MSKKSGAHTLNRLTDLAIKKMKAPGHYADGGNLYLQIAPSGAKTWIFKYTRNGRAREMGLGPLHTIDLTAARELARKHRAQLLEKIDPLEARQDEHSARLALQGAEETRKRWTWCCETYVADVKLPELTNAKHAAQWGSTLKTYTYPLLGEKWVDEITLHDVHAVLTPIWLTINETATRVRSRMEAVLSWAKVKGYRKGDNPAAWKGNLQHLLAAPSMVQEEEHYPSLPFDKMPDFMAALHEQQDAARKFKRSIASSMGLEFAILTAQRTNPIITAEWSEIHFDKHLWLSPKEHMKGAYGHRCPLSRRAIEILRTMEGQRNDDSALIFQHAGKRLHSTSLIGVIQNMDEKRPGVWVDPKINNRRVTPHGFRSSFLDWAAESTDYENAACRLALAHSKGDKTEAAYWRADMLKKREPIMAHWARFCGV